VLKNKLVSLGSNLALYRFIDKINKWNIKKCIVPEVSVDAFVRKDIQDGFFLQKGQSKTMRITQNKAIISSEDLFTVRCHAISVIIYDKQNISL